MDTIVPFPVKIMRLQPDLFQFLMGHFDLGGIFSFVQFCLHAEPLTGGGLADQLDDDLVADQRPSPPVHADMGKQAMFDLVLFARPGGGNDKR